MTANLQTTKQLAIAFNVSERQIYIARKVLRLRPDLEGPVMAGTMTLNQAHAIATGKQKETSFDRLLRAWRNATDADRRRLLELIG